MTEALAAAGIAPHYCANVTGHGWRKLMRHPGAFTYRLHTLPQVPPVLDFIRQQAGIDEREAYGNLNMGAGFALFLAAARRGALRGDRRGVRRAGVDRRHAWRTGRSRS